MRKRVILFTINYFKVLPSCYCLSSANSAEIDWRQYDICNTHPLSFLLISRQRHLNGYDFNIINLMYIIPYFRHGLIVPQTSRMSAAAAAASSGTLPSGPSVFRETPLSEGEISNNLKDELKRMKRRRQLASQNIKAQMGAGSPVISNSSINRIDGMPRSPCLVGSGSAPGSPEPMNQELGNMSPRSASASQVLRASISTSRELEPSSSQMSPNASSGLNAGSSIQCNSSNVPSTNNSNIKALMGTGDKPVFTLKQMTLICERMCKVN